MIQRTTQSVAELNIVGDEIMKELQVNKEKIKSSTAKVKYFWFYFSFSKVFHSCFQAEEINAGLDSAQKTLKGMKSRDKCSIQ